MPRIRLRQPSPPLSRNEKISSVLSILAMIVALFAAVVSSLATYYWFDPTTKEYKERGQLLYTAGENVSEYNYYTSDYTGPRWDIGSVSTLVNAGNRPLKLIELYVGSRLGDGTSINLTVDDRVVEKVKEASHFTVFAVSGAFAPGDRMVVRFRGSKDAGVFALTEHGDRLEIVDRKVSWNTTMPASAVSSPKR